MDGRSRLRGRWRRDSACRRGSARLAAENSAAGRARETDGRLSNVRSVEVKNARTPNVRISQPCSASMRVLICNRLRMAASARRLVTLERVDWATRKTAATAVPNPSRRVWYCPCTAPALGVGHASQTRHQPFNSASRASTSRLPIWRRAAMAFSESARGLAFPASHA